MAEETTRKIGNRGEDLACEFLEKKGLQILERNYYAGRSEIDIIAKDGPIYVFIEVKMRSSAKFGYPIEFVTEEKVAHVFAAAERWMQEQNLQDRPLRFDVVGIIKAPSRKADITHYQDAYR